MPHVAHYLGLLHRAQEALAAAFREIADGHAEEADVFHTCQALARECDRHAADRPRRDQRTLRTRAAAVLKIGCLEAASQSVSVSSLAARRWRLRPRPSTSQ